MNAAILNIYWILSNLQHSIIFFFLGGGNIDTMEKYIGANILTSIVVLLLNSVRATFRATLSAWVCKHKIIQLMGNDKIDYFLKTSHNYKRKEC